MTPKDILVKARALISNPENWTTHALARDVNGFVINHESTDAKSWCALGAMLRINTKHIDSYPYRAGELLDRVAIEMSDMQTDFVIFNNSSSHEEVLEMFDRAIQLAE